MEPEKGILISLRDFGVLWILLLSLFFGDRFTMSIIVFSNCYHFSWRDCRFSTTVTRACRGGMRWSWFRRIVKVWPISVTSSHIKLQMKSALFPHDSSQFSSYRTFHFDRVFQSNYTQKKLNCPQADEQSWPFVTFSPSSKSSPWSRMDGAYKLRECHQATVSRAITAVDFFASQAFHPLFGCDFQGHINHRETVDAKVHTWSICTRFPF